MQSLFCINVAAKYNRRYPIQTRGKKDEWNERLLDDGSPQSLRNAAKRPEIMDASFLLGALHATIVSIEELGMWNETSGRTKVTQD